MENEETQPTELTADDLIEIIEANPPEAIDLI